MQKGQYGVILYLVGGFNPFEKYQSNWIISPKRGERKKIFELPPPCYMNKLDIYGFNVGKYTYSNHGCMYLFLSYMGVSKNHGTPKWMVYNGTLLKWMIRGYHYFWKHPYLRSFRGVIYGNPRGTRPTGPYR